MYVKELDLNSDSGAGCVCMYNDTGKEVCLSVLLSEEVFRRLRSFCQTWSSKRLLHRPTSERLVSLKGGTSTIFVDDDLSYSPR